MGSRFHTSREITRFHLTDVGGKGRGGIDHVSRKINRPFHNSRKIIMGFHASRKKKVFSDITFRYILKSYIQSKALFEVFTIRPLRVLGASKRKPSSEFCV